VGLIDDLELKIAQLTVERQRQGADGPRRGRGRLR
jgi:hypothetical protein